MEEEIRNFDCYQCGKSNPRVYFCNEECHTKWGETHFTKSKSKFTIAEIQTKLKSMADQARIIKEERIKNYGGGIFEVAQLIFS